MILYTIEHSGTSFHDFFLLPENGGRYMQLSSFVKYIRKSEEIGPQVVFHRHLPHQEPAYKKSHILSPDIVCLLREAHIAKLYTHQVEAIERIGDGRDVLVSTPTASGKSLIYNIPVIDAIFHNPETRALYIFPLKALEQDQLKSLYDLARGLGPG